jgi:hypothetical protein
LQIRRASSVTAFVGRVSEVAAVEPVITDMIAAVSPLRKAMSIYSVISFPSRSHSRGCVSAPEGRSKDPIKRGRRRLLHLAIAAIAEASEAAISTMRFAHWLKSRGRFGALDIHAATVHSPHRRIFVNPRSCFGFRFEKANVALHSVGECNSNAPCRIAL